MDYLVWVICVGGVATALLDVWTMLRKRLLGIPLPNYGLVGRWFAHMPRGRWRHASIMKAAAVPGELLIGWLVHCAIGIAFAATLPAIWGSAWMHHPTLWPALLVGITTVVAPLWVMQPAMGTAKPPGSPERRSATLQSLITHAVFGLGLYAAAISARVIGVP